MNKKIASEIAIGIILLVAIIVGGIFYWQSKKENQTNIPAVVSQCYNFPAPNFCPGGVDDIIVTGKDKNGCSIYDCKSPDPISETADWHTYINKTSGYKITFPGTWKGYNVKDAGNGKISFSIKFPYSKDVFADGSSELVMFNVITVPISSQTNQDEIDCKKGEAPAPVCYFVTHRLVKTNDNIIYYERGDEIGDMVQFENKIADIKNSFGEVDSILKTFQLNSSDETASLKAAVVDAVNTFTSSQKMQWDKKIDIRTFDPSKKAAIGDWWAHDAWLWIAWEQDDGTWKVLAAGDGFKCSNLNTIPNQYRNFFNNTMNFLDTNGKVTKNCL